IQGVLTCMAKRSVAQIMSQRDRFDQVFVQTQIAGNSPRQLGHFQTMRQSCSKQITFVVNENLGFVFQQAKGIAVNDPVAVPLKGVTALGRCLCITPTAGLFRVTGISGKHLHRFYSCSTVVKRANAWRTTSGATACTLAWPNLSSSTKRSWPPSFFLSTCINSSQRSAGH